MANTPNTPNTASQQTSPVTPGEAVQHMQQLVTAAQGKLGERIPDFANESVALSPARPIRNGTLSRISSTLTLPSQEPGGEKSRTSVVVRGHEDKVNQAKEPTTITLKEGDKPTTFQFGRDEKGAIKATEVLTDADRKDGKEPATLGQHLVGKIKKIPARQFTQAAQAEQKGSASISAETDLDARGRIEAVNAKQSPATKAEVFGDGKPVEDDKFRFETGQQQRDRIAVSNAVNEQRQTNVTVKGGGKQAVTARRNTGPGGSGI